MTRIRTLNNRKRNKLLSPRQREQRHSKAFLRRMRRYWPFMNKWYGELRKGGRTATGRAPSQPEMLFLKPSRPNPHPELVAQADYLDRNKRPVVAIDIDYSNAEERILATLAQKSDVHSQLAMELYGRVDPETRAKAKIINYGKLYGSSDKKVFEKLARRSGKTKKA